jgi:acyl-coenzyme A thioesterase PaaI-like protein
MIATVLDRYPTPPCAALLGLQVIGVDRMTRSVRVRFEARPEFCNPAGNVQGGLLTAMLDDAMGPAVLIETDAAVYPVRPDLRHRDHPPTRQDHRLRRGEPGGRAGRRTGPRHIQCAADADAVGAVGGYAGVRGRSGPGVDARRPRRYLGTPTGVRAAPCLQAHATAARPTGPSEVIQGRRRRATAPCAAGTARCGSTTTRASGSISRVARPAIRAPERPIRRWRFSSAPPAQA